MSHHVIELHFDKAFCDAIQELWQKVDSSMLQTGTQPHITLASFVSEQPESLEPIILELSQFTCAFELAFNSIGVFEGSQGVVFLSPAPTQRLLEIHKRCHALLKRLGQSTSEYYHPNRWTPHCTISQNESLNRIADIMAECQKHNPFFDSQVCEIALIEYRPAQTLFRFPLLGVA